MTLREMAHAELLVRYQTDYVGEDPNPEALVAQVVVGVPEIVACALLVDVTGKYEDLASPVLEVKRVFVHPDQRGRGLSKLLLNAVVDQAYAFARAGDHDDLRLLLETGVKQPEAIARDTALGDVPIPTYGEWKDDENSRCFEVPLTLGTPSAG